MVGNCDVLVSFRFGGLRHFQNGVCTITCRGVHMQVATNVRDFNELGQSIVRRSRRSRLVPH